MSYENYNKARESLDNKDYTNAIIELKSCIKEMNLYPAYSAFCANQLALIYEHGYGGIRQDYLTANEYYEKAYLMDKSEINIFNYANSLIKLSFYEEALNVLNECLQLDTSARTYKSWCANQLALIHEHGKCEDSSSKKAIKYYELSYKYNNNDFFNLYNLAVIYHKSKADSEKIMTKAKKFLELCSINQETKYANYIDYCKQMLSEYENPTQVPSQVPRVINNLEPIGENSHETIEL
jgi:tetratricopeptide (TPR) repeat protein